MTIKYLTLLSEGLKSKEQAGFCLYFALLQTMRSAVFFYHTCPARGFVLWRKPFHVKSKNATQPMQMSPEGLSSKYATH